MKIKPISEFVIPENLKLILKENEYWEESSFDPILITVEDIQHYGENMTSFQADFGVLDKYEDIDGYEWEDLIRNYIERKEPELLEFVKGDSESSTCVIWTNNASKFKLILGRIIELIENENEVHKMRKASH